jgi:hypothetical protein
MSTSPERPIGPPFDSDWRAHMTHGPDAATCPVCNEPPFNHRGVTPCRATRWEGTPSYDGPHDPHPFTYGPNGIYEGHCSGR